MTKGLLIKIIQQLIDSKELFASYGIHLRNDS